MAIFMSESGGRWNSYANCNYTLWFQISYGWKCSFGGEFARMGDGANAFSLIHFQFFVSERMSTRAPVKSHHLRMVSAGRSPCRRAPPPCLSVRQSSTSTQNMREGVDVNICFYFSHDLCAEVSSSDRTARLSGARSRVECCISRRFCASEMALAAAFTMHFSRTRTLSIERLAIVLSLCGGGTSKAISLPHRFLHLVHWTQQATSNCRSSLPHCP